MKKTILLLLSLLIISPSYAQIPYLPSGTDFVLIGDSGKDNEGQKNVALSMQEHCTREECDFGIITGDVVYPEGVASAQDPVLERMFDKYYNALNIPFLIALGNHDYGKFTRDWKRGSYQLLHGHKNPFFVLPHYWYTHETEEAVVAVIDTTRLMWKKDVHVQAQMLKAAYEKAKGLNKWFLVVGHHPYLSNGPHGNAGNYERVKVPYFVSGKHVKSFLRNYVCGKAHFYLAGHDHSLQVMEGSPKNCNSHLIVSGTGAKYTKLSNRNSAIFQSLELGFFHLSLGPQTLKVRAFNEKTELIYEKDYFKGAMMFQAMK